ncbi:ROK family protein [Roseimarinus sediminis]|uniref:ROK family protein n=1 Tax=Roseimarinus sediminis TaxID=1610899 RepID=UPI003D1BB4C5
MILGIDLGGTQIRAGIVSGEVLKEVKSRPTPASGTKEEVLEAIAGLCDQFKSYPIEAIGIGVPSVVDVERGIVYSVTNIPSWNEVYLKDFLEERFKVPAFVNNDANCFAAGEKYFGKGKRAKSMAGVTLGTGLGTGLIFNNHLYEGKNCGAGELCNLSYLQHNYEYYCSGQFFKDEMKVSGKEMAKLASEGNREALDVFNQFGFHLGRFLQALMYAYDPEMIVLGGSVASSFTYFRESMIQSLHEGFIFPKSLEGLRIERSELDNLAIYGAASLVLDK